MGKPTLLINMQLPVDHENLSIKLVLSMHIHIFPQFAFYSYNFFLKKQKMCDFTGKYSLFPRINKLILPIFNWINKIHQSSIHVYRNVNFVEC